MTKPTLTQLEAFDADAVPSERRRVVAIISIAGMLYPLFGVLDVIVYPQLLPTLFSIRLVATTALLLMLAIHRIFRRLAQFHWFTGITYIISAGGISLMVGVSEGASSPYYAGICLCMLVVSVLFTWPMRFAALMHLLALGTYVLAVIPLPTDPPTLRIFANNAFFLLSTATVATWGSGVRWRLAYREFSARIGLLSSNRELERLARRDPLTNLLNRHSLNEKLWEVLSLNHRYGFPSTVLMIDLDNFKAVNDVLGHKAGDDLLRDIATALVRSTRDTDVVYRIGGDEFLVLLQNQSSEQANVVVSRLDLEIRRVCSDAALAEHRVGASIGTLEVVYREGSLETPEHVFIAADQLLYQNKRRRKALAQTG